MLFFQLRQGYILISHICTKVNEILRKSLYWMCRGTSACSLLRIHSHDPPSPLPESGVRADTRNSEKGHPSFLSKNQSWRRRLRLQSLKWLDPLFLCFSAFSRYTPFCKQFFRVVHHSFEIYEANLKEICEIVCNCFSEDVRLLGKYLCRKCTAPNCADSTKAPLW